MKPLVGIVAGTKKDLGFLEPAGKLLQDLDVSIDNTVLDDYQDSLEKLYLYSLTSVMRGLEVMIMGGDDIPCQVHALSSMTPVPIIYVPATASDLCPTSFLPQAPDSGNTRSALLVTRPGDAYTAGLWAARMLAAKHVSIHQSIQAYDGRLSGESIENCK